MTQVIAEIGIPLDSADGAFMRAHNAAAYERAARVAEAEEAMAAQWAAHSADSKARLLAIATDTGRRHRTRGDAMHVPTGYSVDMVQAYRAGYRAAVSRVTVDY